MILTDHTMKPQRALIIGASMSGLFSAVLLRKAGWVVDIYERSDVELFGRGAGIVTHQELLKTLERCGAELRDLGITIYDRIALDRDGKVVERLPFEQIVTSWDRLHQIMRACIEQQYHHLSHNLVAIEEDARSITAVFADGRRETGDIIIAADGYRSTVRQLVVPEVVPLYAGYVVWRGLADEPKIPKYARDAIFEKFAFYLPPNNKNIGYPIAGLDNDLRPGHRRYNWVWYRPVSQSQLENILTDSDGTKYDYGISPAKIRSEIIDALKHDARDFLPPAMLDTLMCVERPFFTPIYDLVVPQMVYGRIAIIGDAAGTARPHIGMGIAKAGSDAEALADSLSASGPDVLSGLANFQAERLPIVVRAVQQGRDLGEFMLSDGTPDESKRWKEFHSIKGIMTHTASSAFLHVPV